MVEAAAAAAESPELAVPASHQQQQLPLLLHSLIVSAAVAAGAAESPELFLPSKPAAVATSAAQPDGFSSSSMCMKVLPAAPHVCL